MKPDYEEIRAVVAAAKAKGLLKGPEPVEEPPRSTNTYFRRGLEFKALLRIALDRAKTRMGPVDFFDDNGSAHRAWPNGLWEKL